jgi:ligand-binding sensor domain-containing protein
LWISTKWGIGIYNSGIWTTLTANTPGSPISSSNNIFNCIAYGAFSAGPVNQIWVGSEDGVHTFAGNRSYITQLRAGERIVALYRSTAGYMWVATPSVLYAYDQYGHQTTTATQSYAALGITGDVISAIAEDGAGNIRLGTHQNGLIILTGSGAGVGGKTGSDTVANTAGTLPSNWINDLKFASSKLWIATNNGYAVKSLTWETFPGVPFKNITQIEILKPGANNLVFFATNETMLDTYGRAYTAIAQIDSGSLSPISANYARITLPYSTAANTPIWSTKMIKYGGIWVGGSFGMVENAFVAPVGRSFEISTVELKGVDEIWAGTKGGGCLKLVIPSGPTWTNYISANQTNVTSLAFIDSSFLWMGTDKGLFKCPVATAGNPIESYLLTTNIEPNPTMYNGAVNNIFIGPSSVWISTADSNNVYQYNGTNFTRYETINSGLLPGDIKALNITNSGGTIWIGTTGGLSRYKP